MKKNSKKKLNFQLYDDHQILLSLSLSSSSGWWWWCDQLGWNEWVKKFLDRMIRTRSNLQLIDRFLMIRFCDHWCPMTMLFFFSYLVEQNKKLRIKILTKSIINDTYGRLTNIGNFIFVDNGQKKKRKSKRPYQHVERIWRLNFLWQFLFLFLGYHYAVGYWWWQD